MSRPGRVLVVTGTSTGVGKTVVTAALSSVLAARGEQVVVVKPVQTGIADGDCDAEEVHRLTGCAVQEHAALDEPLAPETAARRAGVTLPTVAEHADRLKVHTEFHDTVVVEGIPVRGLVIGSWPDSPGLAETCNREDLPRVTGVPLLGAVPAGAGALGREEFTAEAGGWLPGW